MAPKQNLIPHTEVTLTEEEREMMIKFEELKQIGTPVVNLRLDRKQKTIIDKLQTPLWKFEDIFMNEQRGKGNSEYTIKYYRRCFKKLYIFLTFELTVTEDDYQKVLDSCIAFDESPKELLGKMQMMATLELDDIEQKYRTYLEEIEKVNPQTVNSYFRGHRAIMYYAMENGWISNHKITITTKEAPIKNCYTDSEINKLLRKPDVKDFVEYRNWVIINYLLATGNRVSSIVDINVGDVDLDEGYINVNRQKNKKPARLGLISKMQNVLREYIAYYRTSEDGTVLFEEPLFCNRFGERLTDNGLKKAIAEYNKSRGVTKTSIHLFRHTFAKQWIMSGGDPISLQKMLGHSSLKMVAHYSNLYASDTKQKAEQHSPLAHTKTKSGKILKMRNIA